VRDSEIVTWKTSRAQSELMGRYALFSILLKAASKGMLVCGHPGNKALVNTHQPGTLVAFLRCVIYNKHTGATFGDGRVPLVRGVGRHSQRVFAEAILTESGVMLS
jgi:hypothetical protein